MTIAIIFVKLEYIFPTDSSILVNKAFANASKLVQLNNRQDI